MSDLSLLPGHFAGSYTVTITDGAGCKYSSSIDIDERIEYYYPSARIPARTSGRRSKLWPVGSVTSMDQVICQAGNSIKLNPFFEVAAGASFVAEIVPCGFMMDDSEIHARQVPLQSIAPAEI